MCAPSASGVTNAAWNSTPAFGELKLVRWWNSRSTSCNTWSVYEERRVYLLSVAQMLRFNVAERLPVGVPASSAAGSHLRQRLALHGMALLVIPA